MKMAALFCLLAGNLAALAWRCWRLPERVSFDVNEGWNAFHALAVMHKSALYPGLGATMVNNYPPLSFLLIAPFGDHVLAGRALSLLGLLATCGAVYVAVARATDDRRAALLGACVLAGQLQLFSHYVGINDPQLLAHGLAAFAVPLAMRARPPIAAIAALLAAGFFTKHSLVAAPLAIVWALALRDHRTALRLVLTGTLVALFGLSAMAAAYGKDSVLALLAPRPWSLSAAAHALLMWALNRAPLLLIGVCCRQPLFLVYFGIATFFGFAFAGGEGVDRNAFFDADIALALCVGACASAAAKLVPAVTAASLAVAAAVVLSAAPARREDAEPLIALLQRSPGEVWCSDLAYCYWAKKPPVLDRFNLGLRFRQHPELATPLREALARGHYSVLHLDGSVREVPGADAIIAQRYRQVSTRSDGSVWLPR